MPLPNSPAPLLAVLGSLQGTGQGHHHHKCHCLTAWMSRLLIPLGDWEMICFSVHVFSKR